MGLRITFVKVHKTLWRKSGSGGGVERDAVGLVLMGFFLAKLSFLGLDEQAAVARDIVQHAIELIEDILAVADRIDSQDFMEAARHFDGVLMREDMTHFVAEHSGEFIVVAKKSDHFAGDVDASGSDAERVHDGFVDENDAKLQLRGRELSQDAIGDVIEACGQLIVMDDTEILFQPFRFDVAQIQFLLRAKHVGGRRGREDRGSRTLLLGTRRAGTESQQGAQDNGGSNLHSRTLVYHSGQG